MEKLTTHQCKNTMEFIHEAQFWANFSRDCAAQGHMGAEVQQMCSERAVLIENFIHEMRKLHERYELRQI